MIDSRFWRAFKVMKYELQIPILEPPYTDLIDNSLYTSKTVNNSLIYKFIYEVMSKKYIDRNQLFDILRLHSDDLGIKSRIENNFIYLDLNNLYYAYVNAIHSIVAYQMRMPSCNRSVYNRLSLELYNPTIPPASVIDVFGGMFVF